MRFLLLFLLALPINSFADSECINREFDGRLDDVGEVTGEEYSEMVEFCDLQEVDNESVGE